MATLTREDEKVISRKSQSSSTAESEAEKADDCVSVLYNSQTTYSC